MDYGDFRPVNLAAIYGAADEANSRALQNQLVQAQLKKQTDADAEDELLKSTIRQHIGQDGSIDYKTAIPAIMASNPAAGMKLAKMYQDQQLTDQQTQTAKAERLTKSIGFMRDASAHLISNPSLPLALQLTKQYGDLSGADVSSELQNLMTNGKNPDGSENADFIRKWAYGHAQKAEDAVSQFGLEQLESKFAASGSPSTPTAAPSTTPTMLIDPSQGGIPAAALQDFAKNGGNRIDIAGGQPATTFTPPNDPKKIEAYRSSGNKLAKEKAEAWQKENDTARVQFNADRSYNLQAKNQQTVADEKKAAAANDVPLDDASLRTAAEIYRKFGTLPPLGMKAANDKKRIMNEAARLDAADGYDAAQSAFNRADGASLKAGLTQLTKQQTMVGAFERNFTRNAKLALDLSKDVARDGMPIVNSWINAGKRAVEGDPKLSAYDVAVKSVINEYAKIISGSMGNTATAEGEIRNVEAKLSAAMTPQQVEAVINFMMKETQNRMVGFDEQRKEIENRLRGGKPAAGDAGKPTPTVPTAIKEGTISKSKTGKTIIFKNGKWDYYNG